MAVGSPNSLVLALTITEINSDLTSSKSTRLPSSLASSISACLARAAACLAFDTVSAGRPAPSTSLSPFVYFDPEFVFAAHSASASSTLIVFFLVFLLTETDSEILPEEIAL